MKYGLDENQLCEIVDIFRKYPEVEEAILFGSRAIGTYKEASDIDIAIKGKDVSVILATKIQSDLEDTYLPFFFDIISFPSITNQDLIKHINTKGISIYRAGWKKCKLGDVVVMHYGKALPSGKRIKGDIPVYGSAGIIGYHNEPLSNTKGLIIGRKGNIGCVYKSMEPFFAIDTTFYVQPNDDLYDMDYLYYMLLNYRFDLLNEDSAVPGLNRKTAYFQDIYLPPLHKQKEIASILSCLDDKIDLLHRQNKTLESITQTLFHQWFIKEADENWERKSLSFFGRVVCGKTPPKKHQEYFNGHYLFLKIPDMHEKVFIFDTYDKLSNKGKESQLNKTIPPNSICVSCIATVGLVSMNAIECHTNQQINSIIPYKEHYRYYIYLTMKSQKDSLISLASGGTATLNLNTKEFSNMSLLFPGEGKLKDYHFENKDIFDKIYQNQRQCMVLDHIRNNILSILIETDAKKMCVAYSAG
jgi:type I restriction enzyme, S subunit